jgi:ApbE superfamily uncharacterized protein (UPF0280 family)
MSAGPIAGMLADGRRLHLQQGPIDLIAEAFGTPEAVQAAYRAAARRLHGQLEALCAELVLLRSAHRAGSPSAQDVVARRMQAAVAPYAEAEYITPMAAVAGSIADEILAAMVHAAPLRRAYVNNGGDIALHLAEGERFVIGLVDRPDRPSLFSRAEVASSDRARGIATSGWRGRSFSLGIADAVTVLASDAAMADAAATIIANAVDLPGHPGITREPASALQPDSDLGERLVTRAVATLSPQEIDLALARGATRAASLAESGLIEAAALHLAGATKLVPATHSLLLPHQPEAA